jgi:hypothetical protein
LPPLSCLLAITLLTTTVVICVLLPKRASSYTQLRHT